MTEISRSALFGRLNPTALKAIETATGFCRMRGNPYVELVHWLHVLVQDADNDVAAIRTAFGLDGQRLGADLIAALDRLPRGATAVSDFAPQIEETIERGWLYASLLFGERQARSGHLIFAHAQDADAAQHAVWHVGGMAQGRGRAARRGIRRHRCRIVGRNRVRSDRERRRRPRSPSAAAAPGEALARFSVDLTERARSGAIDRIVGRDAEIRQMIDILLRRRQNNPILTGEAGVGKTAIVEGLARRIADGDVPPALADVALHALDIGLLQAGAGVKGEFEKRLRQVIDEVESSPRPIILFIDEAHTLIGAGGAAGTGDAANLLKPALARGRLRTIAATTWAEYRQYIEKDPALTRRFQPIAVGEPDTERAIAMLRSLKAVMEAHHKVVILDEAVEAAVRLSQRYVPARQLPDKAVSLLDTAAARVAVSQHATPAPVEDGRRRHRTDRDGTGDRDPRDRGALCRRGSGRTARRGARGGPRNACRARGEMGGRACRGWSGRRGAPPAGECRQPGIVQGARCGAGIGGGDPRRSTDGLWRGRCRHDRRRRRRLDRRAGRPHGEGRSLLDPGDGGRG